MRTTSGFDHGGRSATVGRQPVSPPPAAHRTAGMLRERAKEIEEAQKRAKAERREAQRRRASAEAEKAQQARLKILKQRGVSSMWKEIEQEIERCNPARYENAMSLFFDVQALSKQEGDWDGFDRHLGEIRVRHEKKAKFIERLGKLGRGGSVGTVI